MLRVYYHKDGEAYSDLKVEEKVEFIADNIEYINDDYKMFISTENFIYALRLAILKGKLDYDNVIVHFDEKSTMFDKSAKPTNYYPSMFFDKALDTLLGL